MGPAEGRPGPLRGAMKIREGALAHAGFAVAEQGGKPALWRAPPAPAEAL